MDLSALWVYHWCVGLFQFLLNCSALSSSVSSAPPPSEPGRRWLRSHPQQQVLCFQDCQQRQFLSLPYQWQESHIQRSGDFTPKSWYWPRPQQISDPAGNFFYFFIFIFILSSTSNSAYFYPCCDHPILSRDFLLFVLCSFPSPLWVKCFMANLLHWNWKGEDVSSASPLDCYSSASWFETMWKRCEPLFAALEF